MAYSVNRLPRKDHWIPICPSDPPLHFRQALEVNEEGEGWAWDEQIGLLRAVVSHEK
jgi:hypothetical protein